MLIKPLPKYFYFYPYKICIKYLECQKLETLILNRIFYAFKTILQYTNNYILSRILPDVIRIFCLGWAYAYILRKDKKSFHFLRCFVTSEFDFE